MSQIRESTYPYQFNMYYSGLEQQNSAYKLLVLDSQIRLKKQQQELEVTKAALDASGLPNTFKYAALEKDLERINVLKADIKMYRTKITFGIDPLLEKLLSFFDDILEDFNKDRLTRPQFIGYMIKYKNILHSGNSLGLICYSAFPVINRINEAIERFIN